MKFHPVLFCLLLIPLQGIAQGTGEGPEKKALAKRDTTPAFVRTWTMAEDYTVLKDYRMDTAQTGFQVYSPVYKASISQAFVGNLGLQTRNNLFFDREEKPDYFFLQPFVPYLYTPENTVYYNITKPFTLLEYFASTGDRLKREEMFHAIHTQNVTPYLNFGLDIRLLTSLGSYLRQKAKFNSFCLHGSYTGHDYSVYSSLNLNSQNAQENGGLRNDSLFMHSNKDDRAYEVNLDRAESTMKNLNFHFTQRYKFGKEEEVPDTTSETGFRRLRERTTKTGSLVHNLEIQRDFRTYQDVISTTNADFYPHYYMDPVNTFDSTFYRSISNTFQLMLDENPNRPRDFGARAFIKHDWVKYSYNIPNDTSVSNGDTSILAHRDYQYQNVHVGMSFMHTVGKGWDWLAQGRYYLFGYRARDLILDGHITKTFPGKRGESVISISGRFALEEPDHFLKYFESNSYRWNNDFNKSKDIRGGLTVRNEAINAMVRFDMALLSDLVYFNDSVMPVQHRPVVTVISGELRKDFKLGILHSNHEIHYQVSSDNNVIRIPDLAYYTSNFLGFTVVKNALTAEIGFDLYYYTKYRALAFSPSVGTFYNQDVREIGNYPYLNLFVNAKLKRARFYVRWDHPYSGLIPKDYFHVLHYPDRGRVVKLGLSWTFYD